MTYGSARSVKNMLDILREYFPDLQIKNVTKDKLTPTRGTLNVDKARELIGYNPSWPLDKGYRMYIEWYKALFEQYPDSLNKHDSEKLLLMASN